MLSGAVEGTEVEAEILLETDVASVVDEAAYIAATQTAKGHWLALLDLMSQMAKIRTLTALACRLHRAGISLKMTSRTRALPSVKQLCKQQTVLLTFQTKSKINTEAISPAEEAAQMHNRISRRDKDEAFLKATGVELLTHHLHRTQHQAILAEETLAHIVNRAMLSQYPHAISTAQVALCRAQAAPSRLLDSPVHLIAGADTVVAQARATLLPCAASPISIVDNMT